MSTAQTTYAPGQGLQNMTIYANIIVSMSKNINGLPGIKSPGSNEPNPDHEDLWRVRQLGEQVLRGEDIFLGMKLSRLSLQLCMTYTKVELGL
jgi:hypothetical protein